MVVSGSGGSEQATSKRSSHRRSTATASSSSTVGCSSSRQGQQSNNESCTGSSHSAPGSPKLDARKSSSYVTTAAQTNSVLSHSYFHTLPEAQEQQKSSSYELSKSVLVHPDKPTRQHSNDDPPEQQDRMATNYQPTAPLLSSVPVSSGYGPVDLVTTGNSMPSFNGISRSSTSSVYEVGKSKDAVISPAVVAAVAAAGYDTESDIEHPQQHQTNRSRQKKFLKNFKQLPQEEVVLQRYSCALVSDILLQGHLYITENYFAFHSNVFGYVTRLQIPVRSVTKITKEKTAKIIPNAVGICTEDNVKHIFASLLSRDTTFKLMTRLWKRAIRETAQGRIEEDLILPENCDAREAGELDDNYLEESSDSEEQVKSESRIPAVSEVSPMDQAYVVKRMNASNGSVYYGNDQELHRDSSQSEIHVRRGSLLSSTGAGGGLLGHVSRSTILSIFVVVLLIFLFCSSMYLVFRVDSLQRQVESRYPYKIPGDWPRMASNSPATEESPEKIQKVLDDNVEQISSVRKSLEKLSNLIQTEELSYSTRDET